MSLIDYDKTLDPEEVCDPHGLPHCRICRARARQEAAIEREESWKERDEVR